MFDVLGFSLLRRVLRENPGLELCYCRWIWIWKVRAWAVSIPSLAFSGLKFKLSNSCSMASQLSL